MAIKPDDIDVEFEEVDPKVKVTPEPPPLDVEYEDIDPNKPKPDTDSKAGDTNAKTGDTKPDTDAKTGDTKTGDTKTSDADSKAKPDAKPKPSDLRTAGKELAGAYGNTFKHPVSGIPGLIRAEYRFGEKAGDDIAKKLGDKGAKAALGKVAKYGARALPGVGVLYGGYAAVKEFKSGDYVGGVLGLVSMVPGPIGWVGIGLGLAWDTWGFGPKEFGQWDKPDGENTYMLQAAAKEVAGVSNSDAALRTAQANVFSFLDGPNGTVWDSNPPATLRLDTPDVAAAATEYLTGISEHFAEIDRVMQQAGEQYISEQRQALAPHFAAMAKLKTQVKEITDQLAAISKGAETSYDAVKEANKQARSQLAGGGTLSDHGPAQTMVTTLEQGQAAVIAAEDKLTKLFAETPPPVVAVRSGTPTGTTPEKKATETPAKPVTATPAAVTPAAQTPAKAETPSKTSDDISKLLSQLGQQKAATPSTSNPLGSGSGLGGGSPLGTGTGGGTGGGTPLSQSKPDTKSDDKADRKLGDDRKLGERKTEEKKLDDKSLSTPKPENAKAAVPNQEQKPGVVAPAATVPAPGAAAPTPAQQNAAHAAAAQEPNKEVDVKGQKTTFPDAKTAKLASLLAAADPAHPVSLADAAAQAGLTPPVPGQDPGKQVSPADAKPGDIMVAGDKSYLLLGDGKFYDLTEYKIVGAAELPQQLGDRAGYFHLNDPAPGAPAPGQPGEAAPAAPTTPAQPQGPVSPQSTSSVPFNVPNATGANPLPADGSQGGQQPAAGTGGVPSVGTPGVPKPAAPGAGPANAESTNTGTGTSVPSSTPGALDPGAVR